MMHSAEPACLYCCSVDICDSPVASSVEVGIIAPAPVIEKGLCTPHKKCEPHL